MELPPAAAYGSFDQVENGVGSVRWLQEQVREGAESLRGWSGRRIAVLTGTSMGHLLPMVIAPLAAATGATFELIPVENDLFGPRVTTAGLLSGAGMSGRTPRAARHRPGACCRAKSVNDDGLFIDSISRCHRRCRRSDAGPDFEDVRRRPHRATRRMNKPTVAIVGRPNVGKSTLFNRLVGGREAIVSDRAGTTRDRHFGDADWNGREFWVVDTGGLVPDSDETMDRAIRTQVEHAVDEADVVLLLVDGAEGVNPVDEDIARAPAQLGPHRHARREQARRPRRTRRSACRSTRSGWASRGRCRPPWAREAATCSTRSSQALPAAAPRKTTSTRSASRSWAGRTSASRRSPTSCSARSATSSRRSPAPRATRSTRR